LASTTNREPDHLLGFTREALAESETSLQAQAIADTGPAPAHAKPRTALTIFGSSIATAADQALAARYQFAILGFWADMGPAQLQTRVSSIKALNPSIKLAQYVMLQELRDYQPPAPDYLKTETVNANNWWHRDASGNRTQWTPAFSAYNVNITDWAPPDATGKRWHQVKAKFDHDKLFANMKGVDYVYLDGFDVPLSDGDWKRIGTNQSRSDPEIVSAYRKGNVNYVSSVRALNPGLKFIGNSASIEAPEYKGQIEGVYRECLMGKSWSHETRLGWEAMMASYRTALVNVKGLSKDVFLNACNTSSSINPGMYRYGLASTLLEDGYFTFVEPGSRFPWYDESDAPLGTAAEAPPTAPTASGIWMRRYTNGLVLVNPSKTTAASINVGPGYKHLNGTIDPVVNNGLAVSSVTLLPRQGLILVRQ
jgi:hypothetical protein